MIRITAKKEGFRRGGRSFSATPTDYPDDAFTVQDLAALEAEPMLVVVRVSPETPKAKSKS